MIVVGTDPHKSKHVFVAVEARSGEYLTELEIEVSDTGFRRLEDWIEKLTSKRVFAIEDCRQVSGSLERFLLKRSERIARVAPKHMANSRRTLSERGKSDPIDALAVARAALREGIENLPPPGSTRKPRKSSCWSITATIWFKNAPGSRIACAGISMTFGPASRSRSAVSTVPRAWSASPESSTGHPRKPGSGSVFSKSSAFERSRERRVNSRMKSGRSFKLGHRSCSNYQVAGCTPPRS